MADPVWFRGHFGEGIVLVDGGEVFELRTEAEARRFLEELGEKESRQAVRGQADDKR